MEWFTAAIAVLAIGQLLLPSHASPRSIDDEDVYHRRRQQMEVEDDDDDEAASYAASRSPSSPSSSKNAINRIDLMSDLLTGILMRPWPMDKLPLLYVEDETEDDDDDDDDEPQLDAAENDADEFPLVATMVGAARRDDPPIATDKRSRYYRKYPWKRQNSKQIYEPDNRYLCQPTKDDVFRLLVALHDARRGTRGRTIDFCNRKRPAQVIFTNIRFLGRRRK